MLILLIVWGWFGFDLFEGFDLLEGYCFRSLSVVRSAPETCVWVC